MKRPFTPELIVLTALSALTHFWTLFTPNAVIFDEVHYKHFAGHYLGRMRYFDLHPPLASLLYAGLARILGISVDTLNGADPAVQLRLLPAVLGTLHVPLVYAILRELGASRRVASLAAFAILCENALLVDSRLTLIEPLLITFGLAAVWLYLVARRNAAGHRFGLLAASAFFAGCAVSAKWTGASAIGLVLAAWVIEHVRARNPFRQLLAEGAVLALIPVAIYLSTFALHLHFQPSEPGSFTSRVVELHHRMASGNRSMESVTHVGASPWYTWPIMKHPMGLWQDRETIELSSRYVMLLGNPIVWWGALIAVGVAAIYLARRGIAPRDRFAVAFLTGGLLINYVPFIGIRRLMYLYHYLFALVFLVMLAAYCGGIMLGWNEDDERRLWTFSSRRSAMICVAVAALVLVGFSYFSPFTFGWAVGREGYDARFRVLNPRP